MGMVRAGVDRAMRDAVGLEEAMKGLGTKDELLVGRVVRAHWVGVGWMAQVRGAYRSRYGGDLEGRVRGETGGSYGRGLVSLVEG